MRGDASTPQAQSGEQASLFALLGRDEGLWQHFVDEQLGSAAELLSISHRSCKRRTFRVGEHFVKVRRRGPESWHWKQTLRGESEMLQSLQEVPGVCRRVRHYEDARWEALWCRYVRGRTLRELSTACQARIPAGILWRVFVTVLRCNLKGVAHRDLKLENVLVSNDGQVTIVDFDQAVRMPPVRALASDMIGLFGREDPPIFTFLTLLGERRGVGRIFRIAARDIARLRRAAARARRAVVTLGGGPAMPGRRPGVDIPGATKPPAPTGEDGCPRGGLELLQRAWQLGRQSPASSPDGCVAYYTLEVGDRRFEGERPWQLRWHYIARHVDFRGKRLLELGCNMGLLSAFARRSGAVECHAVDRDATILASARLVARAFEVEVKCSLVDFDSDEDWETKLSGYDIVAGLSVAHWLQDKKRFLTFLGRHREALFEGHDERTEEIRYLASMGFTSIQVIGVSDRGRALYHLTS